MKAKNFEPFYWLKCNPESSEDEPEKIMPLGTMGAELRAIFKKFVVHVTKCVETNSSIGAASVARRF